MFRETGLLPHLNPGVMTGEDIAALAQGLGVAGHHAGERLGAACANAAARIFGSPDKAPAARLETMRLAGERSVPFTTGILIGIGETRAERIEALLALRDLHDALRPHPGNHHPEFPPQARHAHGECAGADRSTIISGPSRSRG